MEWNIGLYGREWNGIYGMVYMEWSGIYGGFKGGIG